MPALALLCLALAVVAVLLWRRQRRLARDEFIRTFPLPKGLLDRFGKHRPELDLKARVLVARGLRQFFLAYLHSGCRFVSMPSQAVDDLWHEFILYTRNYEQFCRRAFGSFLHHSPAVVLGADKQGNAGLRRVWWYCCKEENLNPRQPTRLPLLFAIDTKLGLADGFRYDTDCRRHGAKDDAGAVHCAADFGDAGIDGGTDGFGDSGWADGSGDSAGDGGCGGGCGGGD